MRALGARLAALNASLALCTGATDCAARVPLLGSVTELRTAMDRLTSFALEQRAQVRGIGEGARGLIGTAAAELLVLPFGIGVFACPRRKL